MLYFCLPIHMKIHLVGKNITQNRNQTKTCFQDPAAAAAAKSLQSCLTLCDPIDSSPPGSPVPGILQARTLEWVAISFSNAWKWKEKVKSLSCIRLLATPWTAVHQAPLSMGFARQEYWSGVPLPSPFQETRDKTTIWFSNSTTGHISWENRNSRWHMSIGAWFTVARIRKQPKWPLTDEWIKMWYIYTMERYSAIKRNKIVSFVVVDQLLSHVQLFVTP